MKKLFVMVILLFVSLNFMACAQKKDNKTRLQRGAGRTSDQVAGTVTSGGWSILNSSAQEVQLTSQDSNSAARAFLGDDPSYGYFSVNTVVMKIRFNGTQVDPYNSRIGFRFYDNYSQPMSWYVGPEIGSTAQGSINGNRVHIVFDDGGSIVLEGTISNNMFYGTITFDNNQYLGDFSVPVQYSLQ